MSAGPDGQCVRSHSRGLAVAGFHLTLCPEDSRSELATAGKLLELLCEPSSQVCGLCFGSVSSRSSSQSPFVMDGSV